MKKRIYNRNQQKLFQQKRKKALKLLFRLGYMKINITQLRKDLDMSYEAIINFENNQNLRMNTLDRILDFLVELEERNKKGL